jgi:hypothetical protein
MFFAFSSPIEVNMVSCRQPVEQRADDDNSTSSAIAASKRLIESLRKPSCRRNFPGNSVLWPEMREDDQTKMAGNLLGYVRASR